MPKLVERHGGFVITPHSHHADDTLPCIGGKLDMTDVVEVQYSHNSGVNWESQVGVESRLIKGHLT